MKGHISELILPEDQYWYLCTPYSKWDEGIDDAAWTACKLRGKLVLAGVNNFCPIVHSHYISRACNIDPYSHAIWIPDDKPHFLNSHGVLVGDLPGWRESKGVDIELKWAREHYRPRLLLNPDTLEWEDLP